MKARCLWYANQVDVKQALFTSPFLGASPTGAGSAVPEKGGPLALFTIYRLAAFGFTVTLARGPNQVMTAEVS